jgi:hypothetical protein
MIWRTSHRPAQLILVLFVVLVMVMTAIVPTPAEAITAIIIIETLLYPNLLADLLWPPQALAPPTAWNNAVPSGPPAKEEYKVGPGRPPKEHQFKPGQSGNPKGAKRKAPSLITRLKELFEHAFSQKVKVTRGEQEQSITMWAAGFQHLSVQFAKGIVKVLSGGFIAPGIESVAKDAMNEYQNGIRLVIFML